MSLGYAPGLGMCIVVGHRGCTLPATGRTVAASMGHLPIPRIGESVRGRPFLLCPEFWQRLWAKYGQQDAPTCASPGAHLWLATVRRRSGGYTGKGALVPPFYCH